MKPEVREIIKQRALDLISYDELMAELELHQVRGEEDLDCYVGYDYDTQEWVKVFYDDPEYLVFLD